MLGKKILSHNPAEHENPIILESGIIMHFKKSLHKGGVFIFKAGSLIIKK